MRAFSATLSLAGLLGLLREITAQGICNSPLYVGQNSDKAFYTMVEDSATGAVYFKGDNGDPQVNGPLLKLAENRYFKVTVGGVEKWAKATGFVAGKGGGPNKAGCVFINDAQTTVEVREVEEQGEPTLVSSTFSGGGSWYPPPGPGKTWWNFGKSSPYLVVGSRFFGLKDLLDGVTHHMPIKCKLDWVAEDGSTGQSDVEGCMVFDTSFGCKSGQDVNERDLCNGEDIIIASDCKDQTNPNLPGKSCVRLMLDTAGAPALNPRFVLQADPGYFDSTSFTFSFSALPESSGSVVTIESVLGFIPQYPPKNIPGECPDTDGPTCDCSSQCAPGGPTFTCTCQNLTSSGDPITYDGLEVRLPITGWGSDVGALKASFCGQDVIFGGATTTFGPFGLLDSPLTYNIQSTTQSSPSSAARTITPPTGATVVRLPLELFYSGTCNTCLRGDILNLEPSPNFAPALFGFCFGQGENMVDVNYFVVPPRWDLQCDNPWRIVQQREQDVVRKYDVSTGNDSFKSAAMIAIGASSGSYPLCPNAGGAVPNSADFFYFKKSAGILDAIACDTDTGYILASRIFVEIHNPNSYLNVAQATWVSLAECTERRTLQALFEGYEGDYSSAHRKLWGSSSKGGW